jgi:hypothetical protein
MWDTINRSFDALVDEGEPILRAQAAAVETMLKQAYGRHRRSHNPAGQCAQAVFERRLPPPARD